MNSSGSWAGGVAVLGLALLLPRVANADSASWVSVSSGASYLAQGELERDFFPALQLEAGMGTDPSHGLVLGGVAKTLTHFGEGTDLVLSQRTTTSGFSLGRWGAALDLGLYQRFWGGDSTGFHGAFVGGLPWGLNVGAVATAGSHNAQAFVLTLGFDWARLTAHRRDGSGWWPSYPLPLSSEERTASR